MKNKAPLALMEQLVMVLVFALAATVCVQVFVFSDRMSRRNEQIDRAMLAAQNVAEIAKYTAGDWEQAVQILGGTWEDTTWRLSYSRDGQPARDDENSDFFISVSCMDSGQPLLGMAQVKAQTREEKELFSFPVAWQEVDDEQT